MSFKKYPYQDYNAFNLDWLISQMRELSNDFEDFVSQNVLKYHDPIQWSITTAYEPNTIVRDGEDVYLSKKTVPAGISITNGDYWFKVGDISTYYVELQNIRHDIAAIDEGSNLIASQDIPANTLFWLNERLCSARSNIAEGESFRYGVNYRRETVYNALELLNSQIETNAANIAKLMKGRKFVLIGDSYGEGYTNSGHVTSWIDIARTQMDVIAYAAAGGYAFGRSDKNFLQLLRGITADISDVTDIVVLGGANERYASVSNTASGIQAFCDYCKTNYPHATVHIGWIGYSNTNTLRWQERDFRNAYFNCGRSGASYLGNIHYAYFDNSLVANNDIEHPNAAGQIAIASALCTILRGGDYHVKNGLLNITRDTTLIDVGTQFYLGKEDDNITCYFTQPGSIDITNAVAGSVKDTYQKIGTWEHSPAPTGNDFLIGRFPAWFRNAGSGSFDTKATEVLIFLNGSNVYLGLYAKDSGGGYANWNAYDLIYIDHNMMFTSKMPY